MYQKSTKKQNTIVMKEENIICELEGGKNPFRVPEGYFENFNERLAARLPMQRQEPRHRIVHMVPRIWRYAAAVVVLVGAGTAFYWNHQSARLDEIAQEEYYNAALDYIMVDNMEIAEYLTEAE